MRSTLTLAAALLVGTLFVCANAHAAYTVTFAQDGSNVVAIGSGSIDLDGLGFLGSEPFPSAYVFPTDATEVTGPATLAGGDIYSGVGGPVSFGSGGLTSASTGSGDLVGVDGEAGEIAVPEDYISGSALSDTSTYDNTTLGAMGLDVGTYVYSWEASPVVVAGSASPSQAIVDTFTVIVSATPIGGGSSVPLPSEMLLGVLGLGTLGLAVRRYKLQGC
jgi:hypothetical protein